MTNHPLNMLQQHLTKVMLQDVSQLINIFRTRILFYHAFFNTDLFLKYKETMGTLWSTRLNPVSRSLKDVHP